MLAEDEAENEYEINVAESLIQEGSERLQKAIKDKNFAEAGSASALIDGGNEKIGVLKKHREEVKKRRDVITKKRGSLITELISKEEKVKLVELKYKIQCSV